MSKKVVFDVGLHQGEDTEYYLARGYKVVAFEADPDLVALNKKRFSSEIDQGVLVLVEGAIVKNPGGEVTFYKNVKNSVWGTIDQLWAERNEKMGAESISITVGTVDFKDSMLRYGVPYYMKIDIEGADRVCLDSLASMNEKPDYISIESEKVSFAELERELNILESLGYSKFKAVQQEGIETKKIAIKAEDGSIKSYSFKKGSSGPFGSDLAGPWMTKSEVLGVYAEIFKEYKRYGDDTFWHKNIVMRSIKKVCARLFGVHMPGWYDTHAMHDDAEE